MEANEYQVGGEHYKSEYQHWDLVCDTDMHYLLGCATKYVSRWRKKNGAQDLKKALHYLTKADELGIYVIEEERSLLCMFIEKILKIENPTTYDLWGRFTANMETEDREIMNAIFLGNYALAASTISEIIMDVECGPSSNYVNPDVNYIRG